MVTDDVNVAPPAGKALVYIIRDSAFGFAIKMKVLVDEVDIGDTWAKSYLQAILDPGHHTLLSKSENKAILDLDAQAGQVYYVQQQIKMGALFARSKLVLLDEKDGKKKMSKLKPSKAQK